MHDIWNIMHFFIFSFIKNPVIVVNKGFMLSAISFYF